MYSAIGLKIEHTETVGDPWYAEVAFIPVGDMGIEFLKPMALDNGKIAQILSDTGEGIQQVALKVDKIEEVLLKLERLGLIP